MGSKKSGPWSPSNLLELCFRAFFLQWLSKVKFRSSPWGLCQDCYWLPSGKCPHLSLGVSVYDFKAGLSNLCIYKVQLSPLTPLIANAKQNRESLNLILKEVFKMVSEMKHLLLRNCKGRLWWPTHMSACLWCMGPCGAVNKATSGQVWIRVSPPFKCPCLNLLQKKPELNDL